MKVLQVSFHSLVICSQGYRFSNYREDRKKERVGRSYNCPEIILHHYQEIRFKQYGTGFRLYLQQKEQSICHLSETHLMKVV